MEDHAKGPTPVPEDIREVETSLPLSPAQLGVYFEHLRDMSGSRFNIGQVTTIAGDMDIEAFRAAAATVIERTPALNMAIVTIDDLPRQVFVDRAAVPIPLHDLRDADDPEAARAALIAGLLYAPFDLKRDPLFRWVLIKTRTGQTDWVQVCHHIAVDAWSGQLLAARVGTNYGALAAPEVKINVPTASSRLAAIRCWRCGWWPACVPSVASSCRCARSSPIPARAPSHAIWPPPVPRR
jgi:hypothetical protein